MKVEINIKQRLEWLKKRVLVAPHEEDYIAFQLKDIAQDTADQVVNNFALDFVIDSLKSKLEVNAGRLAEPLIKEGKQPKEDEECHKAFLMLAHLAEIEDYLSCR
jgi:hypothetical protein